MTHKETIHKELLALLVCPEDRSPLTEAPEALVARLNALAEAGRLLNRSGQAVESRLDGGLVREDGKLLYPIMDGIPVLLIDEAILLDQLPAAGQKS